MASTALQTFLNDTIKPLLTEAVNAEGFFAELKDHGIESTEDLAFVTADILKSKAEGAKIPAVRLNRVIAAFAAVNAPPAAAPVVSAPAPAPVRMSKDVAEIATPEELLSSYDPDFPGPVHDRLRSLTGNLPFVFFGANKNVVVPVTLKYLRARIKHQPVPAQFTHEGHTAELLPVGVRPDEYLAVNPLSPAACLDTDDMDMLGNSWKNVTEPVRYLLILAIELGELRIRDNGHYTDMFEMATASDGLDKMKRRFQRASLEYNNRKEQGGLPPLKRATGKAAAISGNNPFGGSTSKTY